MGVLDIGVFSASTCIHYQEAMTISEEFRVLQPRILPASLQFYRCFRTGERYLFQRKLLRRTVRNW